MNSTTFLETEDFGKWLKKTPPKKKKKKKEEEEEKYQNFAGNVWCVFVIKRLFSFKLGAPVKIMKTVVLKIAVLKHKWNPYENLMKISNIVKISKNV